MNVTFGNMTLDIKIFSHSHDNCEDDEEEVNVVEEVVEEQVDSILHRDPLELALGENQSDFHNYTPLDKELHQTCLMLEELEVDTHEVEFIPLDDPT